MFCKNCGSQLEDYSAFCHNCGSVVDIQPQVQTPANGCNAQPQEQAPVNDLYSRPVEPVQNFGNAPYNASSYQAAKEYIDGSKKAKTLSIAAVSVCAANWVLSVGSLIPFLGIILAFIWIFVCLFGSPAAFVCAIISCVKLGKIKKLPDVMPGSIDPQFYANYLDGQKGAKTAKIINIIYFIVTLVPVVLLLFGVGLILIISIFDGGDLVEEIIWWISDFIEEIFYMIGF